MNCIYEICRALRESRVIRENFQILRVPEEIFDLEAKAGRPFGILDDDAHPSIRDMIDLCQAIPYPDNLIIVNIGVLTPPEEQRPNRKVIVLWMSLKDPTGKQKGIPVKVTPPQRSKILRLLKKSILVPEDTDTFRYRMDIETPDNSIIEVHLIRETSPED